MPRINNSENKEIFQATVESQGWKIPTQTVGMIWDCYFTLPEGSPAKKEYERWMDGLERGIFKRESDAEPLDIHTEDDYKYAMSGIALDGIRKVLGKAGKTDLVTQTKKACKDAYMDIYDKAGYEITQRQFRNEFAENDHELKEKKDVFVATVLSHGWRIDPETLGAMYDVYLRMPAEDPKRPNAPQNRFSEFINGLETGTYIRRDDKRRFKFADHPEFTNWYSTEMMKDMQTLLKESFPENDQYVSTAKHLTEASMTKIAGFTRQEKESYVRARLQKVEERNNYIAIAASQGWKLSNEVIGKLYDVQKLLLPNDPNDVNAPQNRFRKLLKDMEKGEIDAPNAQLGCPAKNPQYANAATHFLLQNVEDIFEDPRMNKGKYAQDLKQYFKNAHDVVKDAAERELIEHARIENDKELAKQQPVHHVEEELPDYFEVAAGNNRTLLEELVRQKALMNRGGSGFETIYNAAHRNSDEFTRMNNSLDAMITKLRNDPGIDRNSDAFKNGMTELYKNSMAYNDKILTKAKKHGVQDWEPSSDMGKNRFMASDNIMKLTERTLDRNTCLVAMQQYAHAEVVRKMDAAYAKNHNADLVGYAAQAASINVLGEMSKNSKYMNQPLKNLFNSAKVAKCGHTLEKKSEIIQNLQLQKVPSQHLKEVVRDTSSREFQSMVFGTTMDFNRWKVDAKKINADVIIDDVNVRNDKLANEINEIGPIMG